MKDVTVREHGFVQLNCSAHGNPMPQTTSYKWIDNHGNEHSVQNYRITSVNVTNAGTYECAVRVNGSYGPLIGSASTRVNVMCESYLFMVSSQLLHVIHRIHLVIFHFSTQWSKSRVP